MVSVPVADEPPPAQEMRWSGSAALLQVTVYMPGLGGE
jgi:hypothetical protein